MSKRFLLKPGSLDKDEVLESWMTTLRDMNEEERLEAESSRHSIGEAATQLGLDLKVTGALPDNEYLRRITDAAVFTHMTNVLRYAHGTKVNVLCEQTEGSYILTMTNDGEKPAGEIKEGGGLSNLRMQAEAAGGAMRIEAAPYFKLIVTLPMTDKRKERTWRTVS